MYLLLLAYLLAWVLLLRRSSNIVLIAGILHAAISQVCFSDSLWLSVILLLAASLLAVVKAH